MSARRSRFGGATVAIFVLAGLSGCGVSLGTPHRPTRSPQEQAAVSAGYAQRPGACQIAPPRIHFPTGEWTATGTVINTNAIDGCVGEKQVRPWDFRRICHGSHCETFLLTATYYAVAIAHVVQTGPGQYVAIFRPTPIPCPHPPGEQRGFNQDHGTITLRWSPDKQTLKGMSRDYQVGPCGGGPAEVDSYVVRRTDPAANPPAQGP